MRTARQQQRRDGISAIELVEESVHLLRLAPLHVLLLYYIGTIPFVLGFLFFWADMSQSAFAHERCARAAGAMALLFVWTKAWQCVFAAELRGHLSGRSQGVWSMNRVIRVTCLQVFVQAFGCFLLPLALVAVLPFGWIYGFFQNVTVLAHGENPEVRTELRRALSQTRLWPIQNHMGIVVLKVFGIFVWLNVLIAMITIPGLMNTLLGIETAFTRAGESAFFNSTFLVASVALTYLAVDPLVKAFFVLRTFYGESLRTAEDLKVDLRSITAGVTKLAVIAVLFCSSMSGMAETASVNPAGPAVTPTLPVQLDRSIEETISQREYMWRLPREETVVVEKKDSGIFTSFIESIGEMFKNIMSGFRDLFRKVFEWIEKLLGNRTRAPGSSPGDFSNFSTMTQIFIFLLIAVIASILGVLLWRTWKRRSVRHEAVTAEALPVMPDLRDENVAASQLPEDGWLKLARELIEKGELRLALRALYLAGLAHLAQRELVTIAKFKSNRDYERELRRRARALPELQAAFNENVSDFDRAWYGMHEVTHDALRAFESNLERIRSC